MTSIPGSILVFLQSTPPSPIEKVIYNMDATTVRQWQIWLITGAIILLLLLVIWQTIVEARKHRPSVAARKARADADRLLAEARQQAEQLLAQARQEADMCLKDANVRAKEQILAAKDDFEKSLAERRQELARTEERLSRKEDNVDLKLTQLQDRLAELDKRDSENKAESQRLHADRQKLAADRQKILDELQHIAGIGADEARRILLERLEGTLEKERGQLIRRFHEDNLRALHLEGQKIMVDAMQRYAGECTYERTTSIVQLPGDEMKGRIIGREGRNIRTIEAATGTTLLIDDTPQAVVISCFDPIRREVARETLEKLIADGRIHPARVEDLVEKTRRDLEATIQKIGQETVDQLGIPHLKPNLVALIGRLKYRYSFSQNVLAHSIEVASLMGAIAAELGLDEAQARRAGLLHDIGKAVDSEVEGSHALIGADLLRRAGESEEIVNAVAAHHEEAEKNSLLAVLVQVCDALSAGRPGARAETTELYLKRLEDLERIGRSFPGVESCFAIQAGRELRVIVKPELISEDAAAVLAHDIAARIEKEMRYPGQIRISVIRETRIVEYAK